MNLEIYLSCPKSTKTIVLFFVLLFFMRVAEFLRSLRNKEMLLLQHQLKISLKHLVVFFHCHKGFSLNWSSLNSSSHSFLMQNRWLSNASVPSHPLPEMPQPEQNQPFSMRGGVLHPLERNYTPSWVVILGLSMFMMLALESSEFNHFCFCTSSFSYKMIAAFVLPAFRGPNWTRETHFLELHSPLA